jgi:thiol-disulfide isomerase/thioredoxin
MEQRLKSAVRPLALVIAALALFACGPRVSGVAEVGSEAPSFQLEDLQGHKVSLDQFRGKIVLLDFWATWCGPCRMSMPLLEKLQAEFHNDVVLLAINLEEPADEVRAYVQRRNVGSLVLLDSEGEVGRVYQSDSIPMSVLIDQKGIIRDIQVGFHPSMDRDLREEIRRLLAAD